MRRTAVQEVLFASGLCRSRLGSDSKGNGIGLQTGTWMGGGTTPDLICDITAIPEPNQSFDAILYTEILAHVLDPVQALREFSRLLKPGGVLLLTAPFCSLSHFTPQRFSTGFNRYWYEMHLEKLGFDVEEISANGNFFEYLAQELRRLPWTTSQYCSMAVFRGYRLAHYLVVVPLLGILNSMTKREHGSSSLLCFGYHVAARRS